MEYKIGYKKPPPQLGRRWKLKKPRSEQWRKKQSEAHKHLVGPNNAHWKGGRRDHCVRLVKNRDNNTCQRCGYVSYEFGSAAIDVDHILPKSQYPRLEFDTNNMEVLCPNCHRIKTLKNKEIRKIKIC